VNLLKTMNTRNLVLCLLLSAASAPAAPATPAPKFEEVFKVLSTNLGGVSQEELERAAVQGLIGQLGPRVSLLGAPASGSPAAPDAAPLAGARVFDNCFAYVRVAAVGSNLPEAFRAAYRQMTETNKEKIKGLVLDLRFAGGADYEAAARVADCFLNSERPLLEWQTGSARATKKADAILAPVAILVNSRTAGAAEALAAVLRDADVGLILGATTAGQASLYKDFPLSDGEQLRVAVAPVSLSGGRVLSRGVVPDIAVEASLDEERAHLQDPYKDLHPAESAKADPATNRVEELRRRFNEAELVREHKAGEEADTGDAGAAAGASAAVAPVMADPVLGRALDLLKGLAVVQPNRPG
jgi:hypothetical protein